MNKNKVVLAGAGTMGASLAQVYAQAGWDTVLWNRSAAGLERAKSLISLNQATFIKEGILVEVESNAMLSRIRMTTDKADYQDAALVVESIVEKLDAKQASGRRFPPWYRRRHCWPPIPPD